MFDIGWQELLVLGAVAMVIFPPREYPHLLRGVIDAVHRLRRMGEDVREGIDKFSQQHLPHDLYDVGDEVKHSIGGGLSETSKLARQSAENMRKQIAELEDRARGIGKRDTRTARTPTARTPTARTPTARTRTTTSGVASRKTTSSVVSRTTTGGRKTTSSKAGSGQKKQPATKSIQPAKKGAKSEGIAQKTQVRQAKAKKMQQSAKLDTKSRAKTSAKTKV